MTWRDSLAGRPLLLAVLGGVLVLGVAGCTPSPSHSAAPPARSTTTSKSVVSAPLKVGPAHIVSPPSSTSTTPTTAPGLRDLVVTDAVRAQLTAVFVADKHIDPSDITGTAPDSVYYAYDPSTQTYWAMASFVPSTADPEQVLIGMQDGGSDGYFKMVGGGEWQVSLGAYPAICGEKQFFPPAVIALWSLSTEAASSCS